MAIEGGHKDLFRKNLWPHSSELLIRFDELEQEIKDLRNSRVEAARTLVERMREACEIGMYYTEIAEGVDMSRTAVYGWRNKE